MPASALRRPLPWLLLAYMAALFGLRARGFFQPRPTGRPGPVSLELVADSPLREDRFGWKIECGSARGRLLVRWRRDADAERLPLPGETARVEGRLRAPRPARNPGDFDEAAFLADRGIAWILEARATGVTTAPVPWRARPFFCAERLHRWARRRLRAALPADRARLAEGLILGYKGALSVTLARAVRDAGLIHLVVPSGAKIVVVFAGAALVASMLRLGPWPRLLLAAAPGLAVVLASGGEPPYWRAWLAATALLAARAGGAEGDPFQALLLSAWLQLLFCPRALFSAGFQMTYAAMLALAAFRPRTGLGVALAVQAALWPIFAGTFGRGAAVGLLANAVAVPAYPFYAALAWAACAVPALGPALSAALAGFERLCSFAASLPAAAVTLSPWPWTSVVAYYLALAGLSRPRSKAAVPLLAAALALRAGAAVEARAAAPALRVVYLNVPRVRAGRRHAALVTFDGRLTWLVGAAPPALVAKACRAYGLSRPDGEIPWSPRLKVCAGANCLPLDQNVIIAAPVELHVQGR